MVVSFFGHRDYPKERVSRDEPILLRLLEDTFGDNEVEFFLGGYGNFDAFAYNCCKKYHETHSNAKLIFVTPYITKSYGEGLELIRDKYDEIIFAEIENSPPKYAISHRNNWIVDKSDYVIAYVSLSFGGAYSAFARARRKKKLLYNFGKY